MVKKLRVRMFGVFSAAYGDEVLTFGRQGDSKFCQLFQLLMTRPGQGFSKKSVAEVFYGDEEVENANASLNNTIFRLRRYLRESPLPPGEYLRLEDGVLSFDSGAAAVESDVWSFESAVRAFEEEEAPRRRAELCEKACALYQGEFLPRLSNEMWVIKQSGLYHEMYGRALNYLLHDLRERGELGRIEDLAGRAAALYPGEGWESWRIGSLAAAGRYREAERAYQEAAVRVQRDGGFLSRERQAQFREMGEWIRHPEETAEEIGRCLREQGAWEGAYGCALPGFSDCFRVLKRVTAREGPVRFSLLLCTILGPGGHAAGPGYWEKQGARLREIFRERLRKGDLYTKYSERQYLLLCVGVGREDALAIGARIDTDFRKRSGGRGGVRCRLLDEGGTP